MSTKSVMVAVVGVLVFGVIVGVPLYRFANRTPPVTAADYAARQALIDQEHDAAPHEMVAALARLYPRLSEISAAVETDVEGAPCESETDGERTDTPLVTRALLRATLNPAPVEGADSYWHPETPHAQYDAPVKISDASFQSLSEYFRVSAEFEVRPTESRRRESEILRDARETLRGVITQLDAAPTWIVYVSDSREDPVIEPGGFVPGHTRGHAHVFDGSQLRCTLSVNATNSRSVDFTRTITEGQDSHSNSYGMVLGDLTSRTRLALGEALEGTNLGL